MTEPFVGILTFLGGIVVTSLLYNITYSARFARVETKLDGLQRALSDHLAITPVCQFHNSINNDVTRQDERIKALEDKQLGERFQ